MRNRIVSQYFNALINAGFAGDLEDNLGSRHVLATDNSPYEQIPAGVVFPRSTRDVSILFQVANQVDFSTLTFTPRGGGTSTNGQSLGAGIIIDCSRHLRGIKNFDAELGTITVEAGVVLDELNRFIADAGWFFPVLISTGSRACLGGMANTNACGKGSAYYGQMCHHVDVLTTVLSHGEIIESSALNANAWSALTEKSTALGQICRKIHHEIQLGIPTLIKKKHPKLRRTLTGYGLSTLVTENHGVDINQLIIGSEGTLGVVTELRLKLRRKPKKPVLVVFTYESFFSALEHGQLLLSSVNTRPAAIEALDEKILSLAKLDELTNQTRGLNLVEYLLENNSESSLDDRLEDILKNHSSYLTYKIIHNPEEQARYWELRKKAVGLLSNFTWEGRHPLSGIEDCLVPPENLSEFIAELTQILDSRGLCYGMFGHVDAGCIHVRPAFNLADPNDEREYVNIIHTVKQLVEKYDGLLWGEHGKGLRSAFAPDFWGNTLYASMCRIKHAFDPLNRLNPGKIAASNVSTPLMSITTLPFQEKLNQSISTALKSRYESALNCNGNGACFNQDKQQLMCPSYKITGDRIHSPKGRARLVRAYLRDKAYADAAYHALSGCLGCNGCTNQCPAQVNIPAIKSDFLAAYHSNKRRSLNHFLIKISEELTWLAAGFPKLSRLLLRNLIIQQLLKRIGLTRLPIFPKNKAPLTKLYHSKEIISVAQSGDLVLLGDFLTLNYEPELITQIIEALTLFYGQVFLLAPFYSGIARYGEGDLETAHVYLKRHKKLFLQLKEKNILYTTLDPSIDSYLKSQSHYFPSLSELLIKIDWSKWRFKKCEKRIYLLLHCHEAANLNSNSNSNYWQDIFYQCGYDITTPSLSCCGMAGAYGLQTAHAKNSQQLFESTWQDYCKPGIITLATGYSCRSQIAFFTQMKPMHPLVFLFNHVESI
jgi:FAD/FMN-containing dehydrogenase/Fe-S oxidoreductase